jgi:hypothetical protein
MQIWMAATLESKRSLHRGSSLDSSFLKKNTVLCVSLMAFGVQTIKLSHCTSTGFPNVQRTTGKRRSGTRALIVRNKEELD